VTKAAELAELDDDELQNKLASARRELLNLRFQVATGQLDNTERLGEVRRDIARALTILRARDLSEELVELEPLVLTPARRLPIDTSGGVDEDAEADDDDMVDDDVADDTAAGETESDEEVHDEFEGSEEPDEADDASAAGDEEDAE
jgi:large subunit ribosomal protein L29